MNNIPNQSNLNDIVSSITENNNMVITLIKSVNNTINSVEKIDTKKLKRNSNSFSNIANIIQSYTNSIVNIISVIGTKINGNNIREVLGFIEEQKDSKTGIVLKKQQFTVLEAVSQISSVFNNLSEGIFKLADHKLGKRDLLKLKSNIEITVGIILNTFQEIVKSIGTTPSSKFKDLLAVMVSEPETINKIIHTKDLSFGDKKNIDENIEEKIKKGQMGILDMLVKFFEMIGTVLHMEIPNKMKIKSFKNQLKGFTKELFDTILGIAKDYSTDDNLQLIAKFSGEHGLLGSTNNETGLIGVIDGITGIYMSLDNVNLKKAKTISRNLIGYFNDFLEQLNILLNGDGKNRSVIYKVTGDSVNKTLSDLSQTIQTFTSIVDMVSEVKILKLSMKAKGFGLGFSALKSMINSIVRFISDEKLLENLKIIEDFDSSIFNNIDDVLQTIDSVTESIIRVSKNIMMLGVLFIPLKVLSYMAISTIKLTVHVISGVFKIIEVLNESEERAKNCTEKINGFIEIIESLSSLANSIILFGLKSTILIVAGPLAVLGVTILLLTINSINWLITVLGDEKKTLLVIIALRRIERVFIKLSLLVLMVAGLVIVMSLTVQAIKNNWLDLFIFLGAVATLSLILIGIGAILGIASPILLGSLGGFAALLGVFGAVMALGFVMLEIMKFDIDKKAIEQKVKDIISIANTVIAAMITSIDFRNIKSLRKAKRTLRIMRGSFKYISNIAESLSIIKDIDIKSSDSDTIDRIVGLVIDTANKTVDSIMGGLESGKEMRMKVKQARKTKRFLSPITDSTAMLNEIAENLNKIKTYKDKLKTEEINSSIDVIIDVANHTIERIFGSIQATHKSRKEMRAQVKSAKKSEDFLEPITSSIGYIYTIADNLQKIQKEVKFEDADKDKISKKVESIISVSNDSLKAISDNKDFVSNAEKLNKASSGLFSGFDSFVQSTNKLDLNKLKETNGLFTNMVKFSESVNGNFNTLAETLTEKIAPLLEELRDLIDAVPSHIDNASASVSSSIFANSTNKPADTASMRAQVQRENTGLNKQEIEAETTKRLQAKATEDAQSLGIKLDELIELLRSGQIQIKLG